MKAFLFFKFLKKKQEKNSVIYFDAISFCVKVFTQ
jgi:hypothetical protein